MITLNNILVQFKSLHIDAKLPAFTRVDILTGDVGADVYAVENTLIPANGSAIVPTGIQVAYITPGFWFKIAPRSGLGFKHGLQPHLGTIDPQYRGELGIKMYNFSNVPYEVKKGTHFAQLAFYKLYQPTISWSDTIDETDRGAKGFGSSDQLMQQTS